MNHKYICATLHYCFQKLFKYRTTIIFSFFSELAIPIIINILFITGLSGSQTDAKTLLYTIEYIVLANIILTISVTSIEETMSRDIKDAFLIYRLTEPTLPCVYYITSDLANKVFRVLVFYIPAVIILALVKGFSVASVIPALFFLLIANIIGYSLSFVIGCMAFWVTEIWGISAIKTLIVAVVAGSVFPLSILPDHVRTLLLYTPFPFLSYVPTAIIMEELNDKIPQLILIGIVWSVIFTGLAVLIWKAGKTKYESVGV